MNSDQTPNTFEERIIILEEQVRQLWDFIGEKPSVPEPIREQEPLF